MLVGNWKGSDGRVTIPGVGALIGEMYTWQLYNEGERNYTLKAVFNQTFYEALWDESEGQRRIELHVMSDKWYEARPIEGATVTRNGRNLTIRGVTLHPI